MNTQTVQQDELTEQLENKLTLHEFALLIAQARLHKLTNKHYKQTKEVNR